MSRLLMRHVDIAGRCRELILISSLVESDSAVLVVLEALCNIASRDMPLLDAMEGATATM